MKFYFLKKEFFDNYRDCKEIEKKENRPFACTTLVEYMGLTFAIPIRSHIKHNYAIFTDKDKTKGLDLSKAVVINDKERFLDLITTVYIKPDEYKILIRKEHLLPHKLEVYIRNYKKALKHKNVLKNSLLVKYSTLQYFHKELNIEE